MHTGFFIVIGYFNIPIRTRGKIIVFSAKIQLAFVNILYDMGIKPDFLIGHSIGELACAYADETLTLEQTVLITYWRGKSLIMTSLPTGAMAAIGE